MIIGIIALLTGKTSEIIILSVLGALTLYIISMIAPLRLRQKEPGLERPFKAPFYPAFPLIALILAIISFIAMMIYNFRLTLLYLGILLIGYILFRLFHKRS